MGMLISPQNRLKRHGADGDADAATPGIDFSTCCGIAGATAAATAPPGGGAAGVATSAPPGATGATGATGGG